MLKKPKDRLLTRAAPNGAGRVGERAAAKPRPTLPSSNRRCRFPASGSPESSRLRHAQVPPVNQPQLRQMIQPLPSLRRPVRPLAAALQMLDETAPNVSIDLAVGARGVPNGKVVRPPFQVPIQLANQHRDRLETLMTLGHFVQLRPLPLDG